MLTIYDLLKGNDLRSIGKSDEVVSLVTSDPLLFDEVFAGIFHTDNVIRARCADAAEKVGKKFPAYIQKKKSVLIKNIDLFQQKEVQWHVALMFGYLKLNRKETEKIYLHLAGWLNSSGSIIVKVACMQSMAGFAIRKTISAAVVRGEIENQMITGSPGVKARGRHLLAELDKAESKKNNKGFLPDL
ncbi:MAG: hypothetical protein WC061_08525 [Melioribacteraceae bacterium]